MKVMIMKVTSGYYEELLQTSNTGSKIQQKKEEIIDIIGKSVQKIANKREVKNFTTAEIKKQCNSLRIKRQEI